MSEKRRLINLFSRRACCKGLRRQGRGTKVEIRDIPDDRPVLIAGPTASGKSALAMEIAETSGGVIVNADALQVYANWRILTARPDAADVARVPHHLYGHIAGDDPYTVGRWLREVAALLPEVGRAIIVGGTGLYFSALTQGLAEIPATSPEIREKADGLSLQAMQARLARDDPATHARIDLMNRMRVQRAWEVLEQTGRPISEWQRETPSPLIAPDRATRIVMTADTDWLNRRIDARFDQMIEMGALAEARQNLQHWDPAAPSSKAIGATALIGYLRGEITLETAILQGKTATKQYAKRQRTWFRARMNDWIARNLP